MGKGSTSSRNTDVSDKHQIDKLQSDINRLQRRKRELEEAYRKKEAEEQRAADMFRKQMQIANMVYTMKKSRLTDKIADAIGAEAFGERSKGILNCYNNVKTAIRQEIIETERDISGKKSEAANLQRRLINGAG